MAANTPNAVALDLVMEEARIWALRPVWLDTFSSLAGSPVPVGLPAYRLNGSSLIQ